MTPSARLQAVIELLEALSSSDRPADRLLRGWFRARRYAGSRDRAAVGERLFTILRRRASFGFRMQDTSARALVIASLLDEGRPFPDIDVLFGGSRYGPAALTVDERTRMAAVPGPAPLHVVGEFPQFLEPELTRAFGARLLDEMRGLMARASVDLRVNTLKSDRLSVLHALHNDGYAARPTPYAPHGIRIPAGEGLAGLSRHSLYETGAFEFQDEAAQIASLLGGAKPRERVLDLAAGAGGKALAMAAQMENRGEILASDMDAARLARLVPRAERAGATIIETARDVPEDRSFDMVFVDAPCSGTGTWRRQPELKWRLDAARLASLIAGQDALLDRAAMAVRAGGRIIYATCSLLPVENEDRISAFRRRYPLFRVLPASAQWRGIVPECPVPGLRDFFNASPYSSGTDGFFVAILALEET